MTTNIVITPTPTPQPVVVASDALIANALATVAEGAADAAFSASSMWGLGSIKARIRRAASVTSPTTTRAVAASGTSVLPVTAANNTGVVSYANYSYRGGAAVIRPSNVYPRSLNVTIQSPPNTFSGDGRSYIEWESDDPAPVIWYQRETGDMRLLCDNGDGTGLKEMVSVAAGLLGALQTAQAGAASTITLHAGASATNGIYIGRFIRITSGTGAGQQRQISGYVGATKVATIEPDWTVTPDNTSVFEMSEVPCDYTRDFDAANTFWFFTLNWQGEVRTRRYVFIGDNQAFYGMSRSASWVTVKPAPRRTERQCFWVGDSHGEGTGTALVHTYGMAAIACDSLGWELCNLSGGGTGYLNPNNSNRSLNAPDRILPPVNAWKMRYSGIGMGGTIGFTQNGVTANVAPDANDATVQAAFDAAFGAGTFRTINTSANSQRGLYIIGQGATALVTAAMTCDTSALTGADTGTMAPVFGQWFGMIYDNVYRDGAGAAYPFEIVLSLGNNDTTSHGYTAPQLTAAATALVTGLKAAWPMATITMIGPLAPRASTAAGAVTDANTALLAVATANLDKVGGRVPFVDTLTSPWTSGSGYLGATTGTGNSDVVAWTDGSHCTTLGHALYGERFAREIQALRPVIGRPPPVNIALPNYALLAGPTFTGVPAAPTATAGTNTAQLATTAFVTTADNLKANLASPAFTGVVQLAASGSAAAPSLSYTGDTATGFARTAAGNTIFSSAGVLAATFSGAGLAVVGTVTGSNLSGTNTGDQTTISGNAGTATALQTGRTIAMTGDVTWTSPSFTGAGNVTAAGTIAAGVVTNAKLANVATATLKGRVTAAAGAPEDLTGAQATTLLDSFTTTLKGLVPPPASLTNKYLRDDGTWQTDYRTITFIIDGGGAVITTGFKGVLEIPFACTIDQYTLLADVSGSIVVDIWKDSYANYPPLVADTITASAKPTISAATKGQSATLTGWTTAIAAGDILGFNVDSITTCQRVTLSLRVKKT